MPMVPGNCQHPMRFQLQVKAADSLVTNNQPSIHPSLSNLPLPRSAPSRPRTTPSVALSLRTNPSRRPRQLPVRAWRRLSSQHRGENQLKRAEHREGSTMSEQAPACDGRPHAHSKLTPPRRKGPCKREMQMTWRPLFAHSSDTTET